MNYALGKNPEIPGYCVREKDLSPCISDDDCKPGSRCTPVGRKKKLFCLHEDDLYENDVKPGNSMGRGSKKGSLGRLN